MDITVKEQIDSLTGDIVNNSVIEKYRCRYTWMSGGTTEVYPITVWATDIVVQLNCDVLNMNGKFNKRIYRVLEKCMKDIAEKHSAVVGACWLTENDGSCPPEMEFKFKDGIDLGK